MEVTEQQKKFCREYMKDFNGTQAAIRAGYSKKTANEQSSQLLAKLNIQKFLESLKEKANDKHEGLADEIVAELKKIGFSDIKKYLDSDNTIKDISQLPSELTTVVESIKKTETDFGDDKTGGTKTSITFKLHSKLDALEKLAKYVGLYEADNRQRGAIITVNIDDAE
jgi:phage terminase small subunit